MNVSLICGLAGPIISFLVSLLKGISFINKYPKITAFILSVITGAATTFFGDQTQGIGQLVQCILIPFAGAVATHEAVTNQVQKVVGGTNAS